MSRYSENQETLDSWGGGETAQPWKVERKAIKYVKTNEEKRLAGFVGHEKVHDRTVYTTMRKDDHYYFEGSGYAVSDSVLRHCGRVDAKFVVVHEPYAGHDGDVYVFRTRDFRRKGREVPEEDLLDPRDTQSYLPTDMAVHTFEGHAEDLFVRPFETALERLSHKYQDDNW